MQAEQAVPTLDLGRIGYEAYLKRTGGISLASGQKLPPFEELNDQVRDAWIAAGSAIGIELVKEMSRISEKTGGKVKIRLAGNFEAMVDANDPPEEEGAASATEPFPPCVVPPSIGRIVIYHHPDGDDLPAIVVKVNHNQHTVHLAYFSCKLTIGNGTAFGIAYGEKKNQWSWPERA